MCEMISCACRTTCIASQREPGQERSDSCFSHNICACATKLRSILRRFYVECYSGNSQEMSSLLERLKILECVNDPDVSSSAPVNLFAETADLGQDFDGEVVEVHLGDFA
jgi:hypothetical protein